MGRYSIMLSVSLWLAFCSMAYAKSVHMPEPQKEPFPMSQTDYSPTVDRKNYGNLLPPVGPYSHAVKHGSVLYLSGFTAYGTAAQGKSMAEQAGAIFSQLKAITEVEGVDMRSLIKVTVFITDFNQAQELRQELFKQYEGNLPASSLVEVAKLFSPEVNIEIEAIFGL